MLGNASRVIQSGSDLGYRGGFWRLTNVPLTTEGLTGTTPCEVRKPDNQDEKVVALLVSQGGRSPTGGASSATTDLKSRGGSGVVR